MVYGVQRTTNAMEREIVRELRIDAPAIRTLAIVSVTKQLRTVTDQLDLLAMMVCSAMEPTLATAQGFVQTTLEIHVPLEANATTNAAKVPKIVSLPRALLVLLTLCSAPKTLVMEADLVSIL